MRSSSDGFMEYNPPVDYTVLQWMNPAPPLPDPSSTKRRRPRRRKAKSKPYSLLSFDEKLKIEKEEETKALKDTNDVPHFPTDDQGRVKKGTRIRDFLPDAPHNFTQDLLEHAQASAPLPPELDDTDFEPKQYGSMEDVLTQNHNRLTELAQASPTTPHHRHPTPHRDNVFFAPHPDTESPPHLPTPPPPSMPTQRISQTDDPLRQELQSALERIRTLEAEVTELKKSRRRTSATSGALTRRKRPRSEKAISAHDSLPATLPDSKPMLVKSPASPRSPGRRRNHRGGRGAASAPPHLHPPPPPPPTGELASSQPPLSDK